MIEYFFVELAIAPGRIKELNAIVDLYLESKICLPEPKSARIALSETCNLKYGIEGQRGAVLMDFSYIYNFSKVTIIVECRQVFVQQVVLCLK